jgi:two-component system response regulator YesN
MDVVVTVDLLRETDHHIHDKVTGRVRQACDHIRRNSAQPLDLRGVSQHAAMARTSFSRAFKKQMGIGFAVWLRDIRLEHARRLLCCTDGRITDIAFIVGFSDVSTFERVFRAASGVSPREYRRRAMVPESEPTSAEFNAGF